MKIIQITSCHECPRLHNCYIKGMFNDDDVSTFDRIHPDCPLPDGECEWTQRMSEYERIACEKTRYLTGCKAVVWRYHHEVINDEPHCPCCGGLIKIKEVGDD